MSDLFLTPEQIQSFMKAQICPWCHRGGFKILALHVHQVHKITAYEFREMAGLNRHAIICDTEYHDKRSKDQKTFIVNGGNPSFMAFDRSVIHKIRERGLRPQGHRNCSLASSKPEAVERSRALMAKLDHKALAAKIPLSTRLRTSRLGREAYMKKYNSEARRAIMTKVRAQRTAESEKRRLIHAQESMRKYWNNPEWRAKWRETVSIAHRRRAKLTTSQEAEIVRLINQGVKNKDLAIQFGVSRSLITWITRTRNKQRKGTVICDK